MVVLGDGMFSVLWGMVLSRVVILVLLVVFVVVVGIWCC